MSVKLSNVSYIYNKRTVMAKEAVVSASMQIKDGEFVAILGRTGCGKTTLLSLIANVVKPAVGTIDVDTKISMMFQTPEKQIFGQTVLEDVMYGPQNVGLNESEARNAALVALHLVGLDNSFYELNPLHLSGGQKRKVALAGILAMNRPLLLLDEPTSGLDNKSAKEILQVIKKLNKQGVTVIMATHDCEMATNYASRIIVMDEGKIVSDTTPTDIIDNIEKYTSYGIEIPAIYKISALLYKKGLIQTKHLSTATQIVAQLSKF